MNYKLNVQHCESFMTKKLYLFGCQCHYYFFHINTLLNKTSGTKPKLKPKPKTLQWIGPEHMLIKSPARCNPLFLKIYELRKSRKGREGRKGVRCSLFHPFQVIKNNFKKHFNKLLWSQMFCKQIMFYLLLVICLDCLKRMFQSLFQRFDNIFPPHEIFPMSVHSLQG